MGVALCHKKVGDPWCRDSWIAVVQCHFFCFLHNNESQVLFKTYRFQCSLCSSFFLTICQMVLAFFIHYYGIILRTNNEIKQNCTSILADKDTRTIRTYCTGFLILSHPPTTHIILYFSPSCLFQFQHTICIVSANN